LTRNPDARLILLDEATAALDSESERQVQPPSSIYHGRTTIVIVHRLHTVVDARRIFIIEDGSVIESGRHDDLLRKGGRYASFYRLQLLARPLFPRHDWGIDAARPRPAPPRTPRRFAAQWRPSHTSSNRYLIGAETRFATAT
jgi:ABC-type glutathione transport system ATPase component